MLSRTFPYILHRKRQPMFNTVDTLMLRTVVHKCSLNILHSGNQQNIHNKNSNPDNTFYHGSKMIRRNNRFHKCRQKIRQYHKDCNCCNNGKGNRSCHHQVLLLFFLFQIFSGKLFFFFLFVKTRRKSQRLDSKYHGINKIKNPPDKRNRSQFFPIAGNTVKRLCLNKDLSVRFSDSHSITILILHHDSL